MFLFLKWCAFILAFVFGLGLVIFLLCVIVYAAFTPIFALNCSAYGQGTHREVRYNYLSSDCFVKMPNGWFTFDQIKQNSVTGE